MIRSNCYESAQPLISALTVSARGRVHGMQRSLCIAMGVATWIP